LTFVAGLLPNTRGGAIFEIEDGIWHVSLGGRFGDYPPTDEEGFLAFAKALPSRWPIRDALQSEDIEVERVITEVPTAFVAEYLVLLGYSHTETICENSVFTPRTVDAA
jgi:hypothetical protein